MDGSGRRAWRTLGAYLAFVLLLLAAAGGLLWLFSCVGSTSSVAQDEVGTPLPTVILDAGHGGEDGGAVGELGGRSILEKDLNLSICFLLRDLLVDNGFDVVMTREKDVLLYDRNTDYQGRKKALDLAARLSVGQATENAVFISIHMNAFPQKSCRGLQVYYSPNHAFSQTLAQSIQSTVCRSLQTDNTRLVKRAGSEIYLLSHLRCPAVLVECGFLSNAQDCANLSDESYQRQLAALMFAAIQKSLTDKPPEGEVSAATAPNFDAKILAEGLIFDEKYYIIDTTDKKTEDTPHERNQNHLYLLGMRNEEPQVAGKMPRLRRMEFLC